MIIAEIIVTGNEILEGDILDTNSNWICKQITGMGGKVRRIVIVRDDLDAIAAAVKQALDSKPDIVFTVGGLGPTSDDKTLQGIALAMGLPLEVNQRALELVREAYANFAAKGEVDNDNITPPRMKMAMLPVGSEPLANSVGAAPGVLLRHGKTTLVALPGVPSELKAIFSESLQPFLREKFGVGTFAELMLDVNCNDESKLAPILKEVVEQNPDVYIKSRPKRFGADVKIRVTLSCVGDTRESVESKLDKAMKDLNQALRSAGLSWKLTNT